MPFWLYIFFNLIFLHSVLFPSSVPNSDPCFEKYSVSVIFPNRRFQKNSVIVPYPYFVFSNTSDFVPYSVTSFEFSPVPVLFPYPYSGVGIRKKFGSDSVVRGMHLSIYFKFKFPFFYISHLSK